MIELLDNVKSEWFNDLQKVYLLGEQNSKFQ